MMLLPQRHHWVNTYLGILNEALGLTDEERFEVARVLGYLFDSLSIPDRGVPRVLPIPLVMEMQSGYYSRKLTDALEGRSVELPPMAALPTDQVIPAEVWRASLMQLLETAYPDLLPEEALATDKVFSDLIGALGVPARRARFLPVEIQVTQSS